MKYRKTLSLLVIAVLNFLTNVLVRCFAESAPVHANCNLGNSNERIAVLIPIIPDVSHTFIYREITAMQECGGEFILFGLLRGEMGVIHPEADKLYPQTIFLDDISVAEYLFVYLKFAFLMPKRFARMISFYKKKCNKENDFFLQCEQITNLLHPLRSLVLADKMRKYGITKIHSYGFSFPATMAMGASMLLGIPYSISTFVDFEHDYEYKMAREKLETSTFVVVCTNYCVDRLLNFAGDKYKNKIHVIHSSIRSEYADNLNHIPEGDFIRLISVARFVEKKGLNYLLRACKSLRQKNIEFNCLIIGDGPDADKLYASHEELALSNYVKLLKPMKNDDIKAYYGPNTVVVMPCVNASDGERDGIPNVLLEAMICGSAAIATNISGIPELIQDGVNGLLVDEKDEASLADALEKLIADDVLRVKLAHAGTATVLKNFNLKTEADRRLDLILDDCSLNG